MALIDDIEFYGRAADAGELDREDAARLLMEASDGALTLVGAASAIDQWDGVRAQLERLQFDAVDVLRALANGKPVPEHVMRRTW